MGKNEDCRKTCCMKTSCIYAGAVLNKTAMRFVFFYTYIFTCDKKIKHFSLNKAIVLYSLYIISAFENYYLVKCSRF